MSSVLWRELDEPDLTLRNFASLVKPASRNEVREPIFRVAEVRFLRVLDVGIPRGT